MTTKEKNKSILGRMAMTERSMAALLNSNGIEVVFTFPESSKHETSYCFQGGDPVYKAFIREYSKELTETMEHLEKELAEL